MAVSNNNHDQDLQLAVEFMTTQLSLTPRQAEVMHWIAEGKTNEEIATILVCRRNTVKTHVKEIFQRLAVHNRSAAVSAIYRAHLRLMRKPSASPEGGIPGKCAAR